MDEMEVHMTGGCRFWQNQWKFLELWLKVAIHLSSHGENWFVKSTEHGNVDGREFFGKMS